MPTVIMRPNEKFYVPTAEEIYKPIRDTLLEKLGKNRRFIRNIETGQADATGSFRITMTPPDGFIWSIRWVQWSGTTAANMNMYINDNSPLNLIGANFTMGSSVQQYEAESIILKPADSLVFTQGSAVSAAGAQIGIQVAAIEVPLGHEAQLI